MVFDVWLLRLQELLEETVMQQVERVGNHVHRGVSRREPILKEHGVPGVHRPVGEQHIDFTRGIKVKCARINDGGKDVLPIRPDKTISCVKDG